jgi:hypothetical protein
MVNKLLRAVIPVLGFLLLAGTGQARAADVTLAWDPSPTPDVRYIVHWGTQSGTYTSSGEAGTGTSYVVTGLTFGCTYYFAVQAKAPDDSTSEYSNEVRGRPGFASAEPDPSWRIVGPADFTRDGRSEMVLRNPMTGEYRLWLLDGDSVTGTRALQSSSDPNLDMVALADFDRDGSPDLLWRNRVTGENSIWYMNGDAFLRSANIQTVDDVRWTVVAAADFNGDERPDILWRHVGTGENMIWFMDGEVTYQQEVVLRVADLYWRAAVVDDFNKDGYPDIVWWNASSGQTVLWEMRGAVELAHSTIDTVTDTNLRPVASGDFDSDGRPELVWQDVVTGRSEIGKVAAPAQLISPDPGSPLGGASATFGWSPGSGVSQIVLYVGTDGPGSYDIYFGSQGADVSRVVSNLPTDGTTLYVRLWSLVDGAWRYLDYTYRTTDSTAAAQLTSPQPGSALTAPSAAFAWTPGASVSKIVLYVGTNGLGSYDVYCGSQESLTSTVSGLPTDGSPIYVRLWSRLPRGWRYVDYTYNLEPGAATVAQMLSPAPGAALPSRITTFRWSSGAGVQEFVLYVGTQGAGSYDLYFGSEGTTLSRTVAGLPMNGSTVYVRLWSRLATGWQFVDYAYTATP